MTNQENKWGSYLKSLDDIRRLHLEVGPHIEPEMLYSGKKGQKLRPSASDLFN